MIYKNKEDFEDQVEIFRHRQKHDPIIISAVCIGSNSGIYGICDYTPTQEVFNTLNEILKDVENHLDTYIISMCLENLVVDCHIGVSKLSKSKELGLDMTVQVGQTLFNEFFGALCKHYHNRNTQVSVKEKI